jgi:ABC-2 type transport system permease protein
MATELTAQRLPNRTVNENITIINALILRAVHELARVPAAVIPGIFAPMIFLIGLTGLFGEAARLPGYTTDKFSTFIIAVSMLQSAGFTGAAIGVNLARDIEQRWFDRMMLAPVPRITLLLGTVLSASCRVLPKLIVAIVFTAGWAATAASWGCLLALRFRSQQAAPLMQAGVFAALLVTTAYAPQAVLTGWVAAVAPYNPVTYILEAVRQGFVSDFSWANTWPGILALSGLFILFGGLAWRQLAISNRR